eukprot:TRINITY_DN1172_c0_g1_i1.p2 TRINITY_DN1172_c0_g1~~TRINITY_DN1172_c0_g1_i1.p2  ORF type:complete len:157 (-),score=46.99 TRINITY_DN1172_c0_g1_i1:66-509(-)
MANGTTTTDSSNVNYVPEKHINEGIVVGLSIAIAVIMISGSLYVLVFRIGPVLMRSWQALLQSRAEQRDMLRQQANADLNDPLNDPLAGAAGSDRDASDDDGDTRKHHKHHHHHHHEARKQRTTTKGTPGPREESPLPVDMHFVAQV